MTLISSFFLKVETRTVTENGITKTIKTTVIMGEPSVTEYIQRGGVNKTTNSYSVGNKETISSRTEVRHDFPEIIESQGGWQNTVHSKNKNGVPAYKRLVKYISEGSDQESQGKLSTYNSILFYLA